VAGGWANSDRRERLPADWAKRRAAVLKRDRGYCQIQGPRCVLTATEVDHIVAGDDHEPSNLQAACEPCHQAKTNSERPKLAPRRRPPEPHPGMIGG
jgi:5-methylcytosine-specific restriction protein A